MTASTRAPRRLLYVEDNPADVVLVKEALLQCDYQVHLEVAENGLIALAYLRQDGSRLINPAPHLILLDLNLPGLSGEEVLVAIKTDEKLKVVTVIVFSSAANKNLCAPVYREHANSCIKKPTDVDTFLSTVGQICNYWFKLASLPD